MKLVAPRILNAPPRWKFSHLKNALSPAAWSNKREVSTGVRWAIGLIRLAAFLISPAFTLMAVSGPTRTPLCSLRSTTAHNRVICPASVDGVLRANPVIIAPPPAGSNVEQELACILLLFSL